MYSGDLGAPPVPLPEREPSRTSPHPSPSSRGTSSGGSVRGRTSRLGPQDTPATSAGEASEGDDHVHSVTGARPVPPTVCESPESGVRGVRRRTLGGLSLPADAVTLPGTEWTSRGLEPHTGGSRDSEGGLRPAVDWERRRKGVGPLVADRVSRLYMVMVVVAVVYDTDLATHRRGRDGGGGWVGGRGGGGGKGGGDRLKWGPGRWEWTCDWKWRGRRDVGVEGTG